VQERANAYEPWRNPPACVDGGRPLGVVVAEVLALVPRAAHDR
jgi:hypothetical protein